ncbi:hypothetical protein [Streptomyces platensis]|uniref:hypothetical protein n=1 Tax=Streptomyces platensis TaxID=58346 RepID=UPI001F1965C2|nr:hypothetical protein [Streptomyces platensis]MCF3143789.1 hypothetical protein [Streptomyces platensis]
MYAMLAPLAAGAKGAGFDWTQVWTLGGVVATGLFVLAGHGMGQRATRKQAAAQADRDLSKWHRELRRQSYVDCIVTYEKLRDMIVPLSRAAPWPVRGNLSDEDVTQLDALLVTLDERYDEAFRKCQIVRLEGPGGVADAAQGLIFAAADFRRAADERARAARAGERPAQSPGWNSSAERMSDELEAFIEIAGTVIAVD